MNKVNLQKMADHIKTIPEEMFNMQSFRITKDKTFSQTMHTTTECDSVACVIGHCVGLDSDAKNIPRKPGGYINYAIWSYNFTEVTSSEWQWCFSAYWKTTDNTPTGASKRIEYLINHGLPENFKDQMNGKVELCYYFKVGDKIIWDSGFGYDYGKIIRYQTEPTFDNCNVLTVMSTGIIINQQIWRPETELLIDNENNRNIIKNKYDKN